MEAHQDHDDLSMMESKRETNMMMKGRRTKRQRPSSPLALTMASTSSTTTTTTTEATSDGGGGGSENPNGVFQMSMSTSPSTNNSIEFTKIVQEDEEEDMANCLILLAQGQSHKPPSHSASVPASASSPPTQNKTVAASGLYLYECKTCNRGFPSFQALGGHRASHKKPPKPSLEEKKPNTALLVKQDEDLHELSKSINSTTLSLQISPNKALSYPSCLIKAPKVHECSICGAEFTSGQALGGHMRRHRSMPMAVTACRTSGECQEAKKPRTLLSLDLNLPAPLEDDHRETQFPFGSKDKIIVFSSSLVDCHF